ncbi:hypothetical protein [Sphingomonas sp. Leaf4]|uniref:hypothetical protein n=1 Tax=Sphingomonas sp. Leaf4 TaxID=2876553 RepID=UPI001E283B78|nr:hypothetical protein [Sphingomonas sp. Leaf4]
MLLMLAGPEAVPPTFLNRPGASAALLDRETAMCRVIATGPAATIDGRQLTPAVPEALPRAIEPVRSSTDACMIARGWRRFVLSSGERRALARMSAARRMRTLAALRSARQPAMGRLVDAGKPILRSPSAPD